MCQWVVIFTYMSLIYIYIYIYIYKTKAFEAFTIFHVITIFFFFLIQILFVLLSLHYKPNPKSYIYIYILSNNRMFSGTPAYCFELSEECFLLSLSSSSQGLRLLQSLQKSQVTTPNQVSTNKNLSSVFYLLSLTLSYTYDSSLSLSLSLSHARLFSTAINQGLNLLFVGLG